MKSLIKNLGIFLLTLLSITITAQDVQRSYFPPRDAGWWTLGINGGWAYQRSDVPALFDGYGFGMTLAKNAYYRPGAPISFDWRGRWLYSQTLGLDTKRAEGLENNSALNGSRDAGEGLDYTAPTGPGFVFQNHKTHHFELGLEGVITANRLRERTGIIASVYGGINADWYGAKIDQADNGGTYENEYEDIDHINDSKSSIKKELKNNILDGVYETNAHGNENGAGNIKIMPSLGVELGYQFTPRFSMHVGHKATWARTDDLDGELWKNDNNLTAGNDVHHYTNLGMRWIIDPARRQMEPPIINVTYPGTNPYVSRSTAGRVEAKIKNVRNKSDVTVAVNGYPSSFSFNRGKMRVNFPLNYGENEVVITAVNEVGSDEEIVIIILGNGGGTNPPNVETYIPTVKITSPRNSPYTSENQNYTIKANIKYIRDKRDIEFVFNGRSLNDFSYNNRTDQFSGGIRLKEGRNEIEVIARNEAGSDRDNVVIYFEKKMERPQVRITSPARSPHATTNGQYTVRAELTNVNSKNDVRFYVNGRERSLFNYDSRTGRFTADLDLQFGENKVVVRGYNETGQAEDDAIIVRNEVNQPRQPSVNITTPSRNTTETTQRNASIRADIKHVDRKNDVRFFVNGRERSLFNFSSSTGKFSAEISLENGRNEIEVRGYNSYGDDRDEAIIIYKDNTPPPGQPPVVTITSVSSGTGNPFETNVDPCRTTIAAEILRVNRKSDITFRINGRNRTDFTFNASTNSFKATLTLDQGSNDIFIRANNSYGSDEDTASKNCTQATNNATPPEVTINSPVDNSTASSATTNLNTRVKNVTRKNDIRVRLNGNTISNFSFSPVSGVVTAQLNLRNGNNTISVFGKNNDGEDEASVKVRYNAPSNPPQVTITKPVDNSTTSNATTTLTATVENVSRKSDIRVKLNGSTTNNFSFNSGRVTAQMTLREGNNTISVFGKNSDGEDEASVRVKYNAPKTPPTVDITKPRNNTTTDTKTASVKATVKNVSGKGDIRFTFNGNNFNNFSYSNSSKTLTANVTLKEGTNTITIKATTSDGSDVETIRVKYVTPKVLPTVKITTPRKKSTTENETVNVKATLNNVASKSDVTFKVNGNRVNNFNYQRGTFTANVKLRKGKNTIRIEASNKDGNATDQVIVTYKPKVIAKPIVKFLTPGRPGQKAKKKKMTARASVKNVTKKNQVKVTFNGRSVDFTFDDRRQVINIPVTLKGGDNKFNIVATNDGGRATAETSIKWVDRPTSNIIKPTITIVSASTPTANPFNPNVSGSTIIATISSVTKKSDITITHNGNKITDFTFDARSGRITVSIQLANEGGNKVKIKATNRAGSTEKEHVY